MSDKIKYEIAPEFRELETWISHLPSNFSRSGETIFKLRNEVKVFNVGNYRLNVKSFKVPNLINRFVYVYLRGSKATRSYRYARKFLALDIPTPKAVGFVDCTNKGLLTNSYYISLHLIYNFTLREALNFQVDLRNEILRQWVRFTYDKLHLNGILHLDYSPGNTLITQKERQYEFSVVDLNRMTFGPISFEKGLSNFCRLSVDHTVLGLVGREYALLRGENPEKAAKIIVDIYRKGGTNLKKREYLKDIYKWVFK
jgi:tRNA A-37 threonylcarbamoyl transferase component Bud32